MSMSISTTWLAPKRVLIPTSTHPDTPIPSQVIFTDELINATSIYLADLSFKLQANAHTEQLLKQKLRAIRHIDPDDALCRLAETAVRPPDIPTTERPLDHVGDPAAGAADVHLGEVAEGEETFMQVGRSPVGEEAVAFHLPELDPTKPLAVGHGLAGQRVNWAGVTEFHLVFCHVYQTLIECGAYEYHGTHDLSCTAI